MSPRVSFFLYLCKHSLSWLGWADSLKEELLSKWMQAHQGLPRGGDGMGEALC